MKLFKVNLSKPNAFGYQLVNHEGYGLKFSIKPLTLRQHLSSSLGHVSVSAIITFYLVYRETLFLGS